MIEIKNISFSYGKAEILKDISFSFAPGEIVGVMGNNGAGKSTLVTCINRINAPKTGQVFIDGKDIHKLGRNEMVKQVSYVAQKNELSKTTVFDSVLLGRKPYMKWGVSDEDMQICHEMIDRVGISEFKLRYIDELSGGELQKVMLARAFVQQPRLLILDEPTSNLDPKNQYEMMKLVRQMARERNIGVLVVIHDISLALRYCDKFAFVKDGYIYKFGGEEIITSDTLKEVYDIDAKIIDVDGKKVAVIQ